MNIFKIVSVCLLLACNALAGKVFSYIGISDISQEEADNAAYAGVAKQVSAEVNVSEKMVESENSVGNKSHYNSNYSAINKLSSSVKLEGVKIKPLSKEGRIFRAQAVLDIDEMTANLRYQMKLLKEQVKNSESRARQALAERQYLVASAAWEDGATAMVQYFEMMDELKKYYPLDDSFKIPHNLGDLEDKLIDAFSSINYMVEIFSSKNGDAEISVTVSDRSGHVPGFPVQIMQNGKVLLERRTNSMGTAIFSLTELSVERNGLCKILIKTNGIQRRFTKAAGLDKGTPVEFAMIMDKQSIESIGQTFSDVAGTSSAEATTYRLRCDCSKDACASVSKRLIKLGFILDESSSNVINVKAKASLKAKVSTVETYDVSLILSGAGISYTEDKVGAGKNEEAAIADAVKKMSFSQVTK